MYFIKTTFYSFLSLFTFCSLFAQPEPWVASTSYSTGALVIVDGSTYIATTNVDAGNTPPDTRYWKSLEETAASLTMTTAALEALPTTEVAVLLATLPGAAPDANSTTGTSSTSKFLGISTRGLVSSSLSMYGGITVLGTTNKKVAFMGKGQTMLAGGVTNYVGDPYIEIYKQTSGVWSLYKTNDNWGDAQGSENLSTVSGSTGITMPAGASEAAIVLDLEPGNYSVIVKSKSGTLQEALVEAYEVASPTDTSRFLGISTRCPVSSSYPAYGGITVLGTTNKKVAFMGKGQTMLAGGVTNYVGDPYIEIYKQTSGVWNLYKTNDNWGDAQGSENLSTVTGSTGITMPVDANEAAIVLDLEPGNYSVILKSKSGSIQEALVEAYEVN
ncbi:hypothetical protein N9E34_05725 [Opitutales bacterium]|nr:hypothetical protein [Opitutales bacterium]